MDAKTVDLDELERDALTEIVNIGVSRAAAALRKMVNREVLLTVPSVEVISRRSAAALIGQREAEPLVAVQQDFEGSFSGRALLIFPESNGLSLARIVVGDETSEDALGELRDEALRETGNIILNACLGSMANMLQQPLKMSVPDIQRGVSQVLFNSVDESNQGVYVLFLYINFSVRDQDVRGYLAMLMDIPSLEKLKQLIAEFIDRVMAD